MRIDAHHHFWKYNTEEFGWIDDAMAAIRRDFLPADLKQEIDEAGIDRVISVQARQSTEETEWLLAMAEAHDWIAGVVGWIPLAEPDAGRWIERLSGRRKLVGVRHVLQAEPDRFMERADFNAGLALLKDAGLRYDVLVVHHQLPAATRLVDRHPEQIFVLDHIAKPAIRAGEREPWARELKELARRPQVYCKLSGLVTEADFRAWSYEQLLPYMETALEAFGPERLMFGTDWPVCRVATSYAEWVRMVERFAEPLSVGERQALFFDNAVRAYGIA